MKVDKNGYKKIYDNKGVSLVVLSTSWCGSCVRLKPVIEKMEKDLAGKTPVYTIDADTDPEPLMELGIRSIPTVLVIKDGKIVEQEVGYRSEEVLTDLLNKHR